MRKIHFFRVLLTLSSLLLLNIYIGWHIQEMLASFGSVKLMFWFWLVFEFIAIPLTISVIPMPKITFSTRRFLKVTAYITIAILMKFIYAFLLFDLIYFSSFLFNFEISQNFKVIYGFGTLIFVICMLGIGFRNAWSPVVSKHNIHIKKPIPGGKTLKIVAVSDLHLGNMVGNKHLNRMVRIINRLDADLILFVGDVLDDSFEPFKRNNMGENFTKLRSKYGKFAVLGNHEYYGGQINEYTEEMSRVGVNVLQDEIVYLTEGVALLGRKDKIVEKEQLGGRMSIEELVAEVKPSIATILMDHQPSDLGNASKNDIDLVLSGHTHRGQMAPYHYFTKQKFEVDWGYLKKLNTHIIVSCGFGLWGPPIRSKSRSEILEIDITFQ